MATGDRSMTGMRLLFSAVALIAALNGLLWALDGLGAAPVVRTALAFVFFLCATTFAYIAVRMRRGSPE